MPKLLFAPTEHLFHQRQHRAVLEPTLAQVGVLPRTDLELTGGFGTGDVDAEAGDTPQPFVAMSGVDDLKDLVVLDEAFLDEGQQQAIFLLPVVEEGASMTPLSERRAGQCH